MVEPHHLSTTMPEIHVSIHMSYQEYLPYYEGRVESILATAVDGRRVQFPARVLRSFLTPHGIIGNFLLEFNDQHKFIGIRKCEEPL